MYFDIWGGYTSTLQVDPIMFHIPTNYHKEHINYESWENGNGGLSLAVNIPYQSCHSLDTSKTKQENGTSGISANMNSQRKPD